MIRDRPVVDIVSKENAYKTTLNANYSSEMSVTILRRSRGHYPNYPQGGTFVRLDLPYIDLIIEKRILKMVV
jgi:hypothetical protein